MAMKYFAIDAAKGLIKRELGEAALTATAYVGTQWDQGGSAATDFIVVIDIEEIDVAASSLYTFKVVGSNEDDRSDGEILGVAQAGNLAAMGTPETRVSAVGDRLVIRCRSEKNDMQFQYIDLHMTLAGATGSIKFGAYVTKEF